MSASALILLQFVDGAHVCEAAGHYAAAAVLLAEARATAGYLIARGC